MRGDRRQIWHLYMYFEHGAKKYFIAPEGYKFNENEFRISRINANHDPSKSTAIVWTYGQLGSRHYISEDLGVMGVGDPLFVKVVG